MRLSTPGATVTVALPTEPGRGGVASGMPVASAEGSPSGALAKVAMTRTVYSAPGVRPGMVWPVLLTRACRAAGSYPSPPDLHCNL